MTMKNQSLSDFLKDETNQQYVLDRIIEGLQHNGEWGRHGLFTRIGKSIGMTGAYVGQVFNGSKPLRENFVVKMAEYLDISISWIEGLSERSYEEARKGQTESRERSRIFLAVRDLFGDFISGEEVAEKLKRYKTEFPDVYKTMAKVPKQSQKEVAEYIMLKALIDPGYTQDLPEVLNQIIDRERPLKSLGFFKKPAGEE